MAVNAVPLADFKLLTVGEAADALGRSVRGVQKLILDGALRAVVVGGGMRTIYLVPMDAIGPFEPPARGRPRKESAAPADEKTKPPAKGKTKG